MFTSLHFNAQWENASNWFASAPLTLWLWKWIYLIAAYLSKAMTKVIVITHPWGLYLIFKCDTLRWSIYKSRTNCMDVLQLLCCIVCEQIKGTLSLCLAWRMILNCWSCAEQWCRWFSWWKALDFHVIKPERICRADSHNLPCVRTLYKCSFDTTNHLATRIIWMKCTPQTKPPTQ